MVLSSARESVGKELEMTNARDTRVIEKRERHGRGKQEGARSYERRSGHEAEVEWHHVRLAHAT